MELKLQHMKTYFHSTERCAESSV